MVVRNFIVAMLLVLAFATATAQDQHPALWLVNIVFQHGTTLDDIRGVAPGIRVLELGDGSCKAEVTAQEMQLLKDSGARVEILRAPARTRLYARESGDLVAGTANPLVQEMVNAVSRDSLVAYISSLQAFGTRYEYTSQRDSSAAYILRELNGFGIAAQSDWYVFGTTTIWDLECVSHDSIWIVGTSSMLVATTDAGQTWHSQTSPVSATYYGLDFKSCVMGWAVGTGGTIIHTTDAGTSWVKQTSSTIATLHDVGFADERLGIAVGSGGVILRTADGGTNWINIYSSIVAGLNRLKVLDSLNIWAVGDSGRILYSHDGGIHWNAQSSGTLNQLWGVDFVTPEIGWAVGQGPSIVKTTNGGMSWLPLVPPARSGDFWTSISFLDSLHGWATSLSGVLFGSTDGGQTWLALYDHLNVGWGPWIYTIKAHAGGQVLCCGSRGALSVSQNGGRTWASQTVNLPGQYLRESRNVIGTIPGRTFPDRECVVVGHYDSYSNAPYVSAPGANDNASGTAAVMEAARVCRRYIFQSTVKLIAVSAEELGMVGSSHYALSARDGGIPIVAAINGDMIGYPTAGDASRLIIGSYIARNRLIDSAMAYNTRYGIGLALIPIIDQTGASDYGPFAAAGYDALEIAEGTPEEIWGGSDPYYHSPYDTMDKLNAGLIHRGARLMLATLAELAVPVERDSSVPPLPPIPEHFMLHQNYPNPFNATTVVRYQLPVASEVKLVVYDVLGREVVTLVDERRDAEVHEVKFDGSGLSSGVYFYRLRARPVDGEKAGDFVQSRKLMILK